MRLALGGPMAVGKSTVGRLLAAKAGVRFVDLDDQIGDIPAIFLHEGEAGFRARETAALRAVVANEGVLALGGGTLVRQENRELLAGWRVVVLMASEATLEARLAGSVGRPLVADWAALLRARTPTWSEYGAPIWTDARSVTDVIAEVLSRC